MNQARLAEIKAVGYKDPIINELLKAFVELREASTFVPDFIEVLENRPSLGDVLQYTDEFYNLGCALSDKSD